MKKITEIAEAEGITVDGAPLEQKHISSVIRGKGEKGEELHRILRSGYRRRVRAGKRYVNHFGDLRPLGQTPRR